MSTYQKLSIHEKRARDIRAVREPASTCPGGCGTQLMPDDVLSHLALRCPGRAEPGPAAQYIGWREAEALGAPRETLYRWARSGKVRVLIRDGARRFLKRDLIEKLAERHPVVVGIPKNGNPKP